MAPLDELEALIEEARWLGEGEPYEFGKEDPLEVLLQRVRGQEPEGEESEAGRQKEGALSKAPERLTEGAYAVSGGDALGELLSERLKERALPGAVREKAVRRITEMLKEREDRGLQELWDLLVFGE